jgi:hypothetical protein
MSDQGLTPQPFEEITDEVYADAFSTTCEVTETRRGVLLTGICPRCGDRMHFPVPTKVFLNTTAAAPSPPTKMMCTCRIVHPGCPADDEGCGAYWNVELSGSVS